MGKLKKAMGYLGIADIEEVPVEGASQPESEASVVSYNTDTSVAGFPISSSPSASYSSSSPYFRSQGGSSMNKILTLSPKNYDEAQPMAKAIREGVPVILNLSSVQDEKMVCRIVDFSFGVVYGLEGSIQRITPKVYILSPAQVSIAGTAKNANRDPFIS